MATSARTAQPGLLIPSFPLMASIAQPHLPQELINTIIEELADARGTLRECSLVSDSFRNPSQKQLFHSITIYHDEKNQPRNRALIDILQSNPRLGTCVESLTLFLNDAFEEKSLSNILSLLRHIQSLELDLEQHMVSLDMMYWKALGEDFMIELRHILRSPQLRNLCLGNVLVPYEYLRHLPQLEELRLRRALPIPSFSADSVSSSFPPPVTPSATGNRGYLKRLCVGQADECRGLLETLHSTSEPSSLSLSRLIHCEAWILGNVRMQVPCFQQTLDVASNTLRFVSIIIACNEPWQTPLDLRNLNKLNSLELKVFSLWSKTYSGAWIIQALESVPAKNHIKDIMFDPCSVSDLSQEQWTRLDNVLTSWTCQTGFLRVTISLIGAEELIPPRLPKLHSNGQLIFRINNWL
ncbi:hypothetical protein FPV67DRAFT_1495025 [Lyophyllum atratum]|nr:hypothetical protein FPV67DRAFT_1495025 [Lyophyllum atratum]